MIATTHTQTRRTGYHDGFATNPSPIEYKAYFSKSLPDSAQRTFNPNHDDQGRFVTGLARQIVEHMSHRVIKNQNLAIIL